MLDERRVKALHNVQLYQIRFSRAFAKKVKPHDLLDEDIVLKEVRAPIHESRGKFKPN